MSAVLDGIDIADAAVQLGLTPDGVRKRIQRGTVQGYKAGGRWYVLLDPVSADPDTISTTRQTEQTGEADGKADTVWTTRQSRADKQTDASARLIETLERENQFLKRELDRRSEEILRRDQIIAALAQRLPALPTKELTIPVSPQDSTKSQNQIEQENPPTPAPQIKRRWWRLWSPQ